MREPLDGERLGDALVGQDLHEAGGDAEVFEGEVVALGGRLGDVGVVHEVLDNGYRRGLSRPASRSGREGSLHRARRARRPPA